MSKQDIEKRLGFAAQGVKETTRTNAKATMATPAESEQQKLMLKKGIASINKSISAGEANLRDDIKRANWSNAVGGCQALSSLYLRLKEMYAEWNKLARSTEYARPGAKAKFGIWGDAPDKYRAAIDFIQNQRTPSSAAISDLKKAIKNRQSEAVKTRDPKAKRMYEDDAGGLQNVLEHAQRGDHSTLLRSAYNLDTAVRDDIPIEMFIWAGADVNWSHRNAKSLLDTVSALVNRTKHGKSVGIKAARPGTKAKA